MPGAIQFGQDLWAGTQESQDKYVAACAHWSTQRPIAGDILAGIVGSNGSGPKDEDKEPRSRLLRVENGVALISIHGTLVSEDNWWNQYAGLVSYNEIRQAAHEAMLHEDAKEAIIDVASPGGHVAGVFDAADALRALGKVKRTTGYTDSTAASAGFWLYATTRERFASPIANVGSIGVVLPFMEYSKYLEGEGVNAKVFRAGKYKALGHPIEKLTKLAEDDIQGRLYHIYDVFVATMAEYLGATVEAVDRNMAQGRVFVGSQAVDAGLIDGVSNFDNVYAAVVTRVARQGDSSMKKKFTAASLQAAAASGAISAEDLAKAQAFFAKAPDGEFEVELKVEAPEVEEPKVEDVDNTEESKVEEPVAEEPKAAEPSAVDLLKEQLAAAQDKEISLKVELSKANEKLTAVEAVVDPMKKIVAQSINNMSVALGRGADASVASLSSTDLLAKHAALSAEFVKVFPSGGVSAVELGTKEPEAPKNTDTSFESRQRQASCGAKAKAKK